MNTATNRIYQARSWYYIILVILALIATFSLVGCGGSTASSEKDATPLKPKAPPTPPPAPDTPSEADARKVYDETKEWISDYNPIKDGEVTVRSFRKTNGQMQEERGVKRYKLEYEAELECHKRGTQGSKCTEKGKVIKDKGSMSFEQTERGWKGQDDKIYGG